MLSLAALKKDKGKIDAPKFFVSFFQKRNTSFSSLRQQIHLHPPIARATLLAAIIRHRQLRAKTGHA